MVLLSTTTTTTPPTLMQTATTTPKTQLHIRSRLHLDGNTDPPHPSQRARTGGKKRRTDEQEEANSTAPKVTPAKRKGKVKGKGKFGQSATLNDPVLSAMARLTLQSAQQHRVWEASLLTTYLGPTDSTSCPAGPSTCPRVRGHDRSTRDTNQYDHSTAGICRATDTVSGLARDRLSRISHGHCHRGTPVTNTPTEPDKSANPSEPQHKRSLHQGRSVLVGFRHMCGTAPPGHHERVLSKHLSGQEQSQ